VPLSDIVNVTLITQNPGVTQAGFGIDLILSHTADWTERTRTYNGISGVGDDFDANSPEYMAANKLFSQSPAPTTVMIGRAEFVPTQRFAVGVNSVVVGNLYSFRIAAVDGEAWTSQDVEYTALASAAWVALTAYTTGTLVTNDSGKLYICITAGTSASSGGPTGTTADITDGSAHWMYAGAGAAGVSCNDAIVYNLKKALDALADPAPDVTTSLQGSVGSKTLRVLADNAGDFFGMEVADMARLSLAQDHGDPGVATDLGNIALESTAWYGLTTLFNSYDFVSAAAGWVESNDKLYPVALQDSAIATTAESGASDIAHHLKAQSYARTAPFFHPANDEFADAAETGRFFPIDPGGDNWRLKALAGVTAQGYTSTQLTNLRDKYCNFYYTLGGTPVIGGNGKVSANEYIDVIRFRDWWIARVSERLANLLIQNEKIPFTDAGIALVEAEIRAQNAEGIAAGGIAANPKPTVSAPAAADISSADKQARTLSGVETTWTLAGALNFLEVTALINV